VRTRSTPAWTRRTSRSRTPTTTSPASSWRQVAGLVTDESGLAASFTIVLRSQPVGDVTIALSSSDASEGAVSPASVTFTTANWSAPQTVIVTGVDDPFVDGDVAFAIRTAAAISDDPSYAGLDAPDASVVNHDGHDDSTVALELSSERDEIEQGEPVTYHLTIRNRGAQPIDDITLLHTLPPLFGALNGTLTRNGQRLADPPAGATQELKLPHLDGFVDRNGNGIADPGEPGYAEFRWQLVPAPAPAPARTRSSVSATATCSTCNIAQPVTATVRVTDNTLFTRSAIVGRVFEDRNRDGRQGPGEPGLANARVVMDEGTSVTTDAQGMFHVPDLEGGPRVVKIDLAGLGMAATPTTDASAVVNVAPGLMASVRFGVYFPSDSVRSAVRRSGPGDLGAAARVSVDLTGDVSKPTLLLNGIPVTVRTFDPPFETPIKGLRATVQMGALELPVDEQGRFAASVPQADGEDVDITMVDPRGRTTLAHVQLPMLRSSRPRGDVVLPFGPAHGRRAVGRALRSGGLTRRWPRPAAPPAGGPWRGHRFAADRCRQRGRGEWHARSGRRGTGAFGWRSRSDGREHINIATREPDGLTIACRRSAVVASDRTSRARRSWPSRRRRS
jgi:uncharacterized repeat protein (TIGR01451 family)